MSRGHEEEPGLPTPDQAAWLADMLRSHKVTDAAAASIQRLVQAAVCEHAAADVNEAIEVTIIACAETVIERSFTAFFRATFQNALHAAREARLEREAMAASRSDRVRAREAAELRKIQAAASAKIAKAGPAAAAQLAAERTAAPVDVTELADWRAASFFDEREMHMERGERHRGLTRAGWVSLLERYCSMPAHLKARAAHGQAMEIAAELAATAGVEAEEVMHVLAAAIGKAVKEGKVIHSLGFIAERLIRRAENAEGSRHWLYADPWIPTVIDRAIFDQALVWGEHLVRVATDSGIEVDEEELLGTIEIEHLVRFLREHGGKAFEAIVAGAAAPSEGHVAAGWVYFLKADRRPVTSAGGQDRARR